jgi:hypothetical protein
MKKLLALVAWWLLPAGAFSQKLFFLYIQAEGGQPFYCEWEGKNQSSTASGYLVLPRLRDTSYQFILGFPGVANGRWQFQVSMNGKDQGYLLKSFGEKGWGLFNLQTLALQMGAPQSAPPKADPAPLAGSGDAVSPFALLLARASDDPSLAVKPSPPAPAPATVQVTPAPKKEQELPAVQTKTTDSQSLAKGKPVEPEPDTVFMVNGPGIPDGKIKEEPMVAPPAQVIKPEQATIQVPADPGREKEMASSVVVKKEERPLAVPAETVAEKPAVTESVTAPPSAAAGSIPEKKSAPFVPATVRRYAESSTTDGFGLVYIDQYGSSSDTVRIHIPNPPPPPPLLLQTNTVREPVRFIENIEAAGKPVEPAPVKDSVRVPVSPCVREAVDADFFALRRQMAAAEGDSAMLGEALRYFPQACFSVLQVRNLGVLFLTEEGRFRFFEAARIYIRDSKAFADLQTAFSDPVWQGRFRDLLNR